MSKYSLNYEFMCVKIFWMKLLCQCVVKHLFCTYESEKKRKVVVLSGLQFELWAELEFGTCLLFGDDCQEDDHSGMSFYELSQVKMGHRASVG